MAEVAVEFDKLFGTHQKIVQTLEDHEKESSILVEIVDRLHGQLISLKERSVPITCGPELDTLQKVRTYITLNEDYIRYLAESCTQGMEICEDDAKLFETP